MQKQFLGRLLQSATLRNREKEKDETEERDGSNIRADDDDDMSGDEQHDDDAVARKARAKKDEENDYEGEEEEKEEVGEYESGEQLDFILYWFISYTCKYILLSLVLSIFYFP